MTRHRLPRLALCASTIVLAFACIGSAGAQEACVPVEETAAQVQDAAAPLPRELPSFPTRPSLRRPTAARVSLFGGLGLLHASAFLVVLGAYANAPPILCGADLFGDGESVDDDSSCASSDDGVPLFIAGGVTASVGLVLIGIGVPTIRRYRADRRALALELGSSFARPLIPRIDGATGFVFALGGRF